MKTMMLNLLTIVAVVDVLQMLNSSDLRPDHYDAQQCSSYPS